MINRTALVFIFLIFYFIPTTQAAQLIHQSYFESGSSSIDTNEAQLLIAQLKAISRDGFLWVIGYSDEYGADSPNIILSQKRADHIKKMIMRHTDLEESQIKALANGKDKTNISNVFKRRVEIFNLGEVENKPIPIQLTNEVLSERKLASSQTIISEENESKKTPPTSEISKDVNSEELVDTLKSLKTSVDSLNENLKDSKSIIGIQKNLIENTEKMKNVISDSNREDLAVTEDSIPQKAASGSLAPSINDVEGNSISKPKQIATASSASSFMDFFKKTDYELRLNYYSANQNANLDSLIDNNQLLSDPRLSLGLNTSTEVSKNLSFLTEIGVRWNEYSDANSSSLAVPWSGYGFYFGAGVQQSLHKTIDHSLKIGFEQVLSYKELSPLIYEITLEPTFTANYSLHFNFFEDRLFTLAVSPGAKLIVGTHGIDNGLGYGLGLKSYFGTIKKYFLVGNYYNDHYKSEGKIFTIEILELGFGVKF